MSNIEIIEALLAIEKLEYINSGFLSGSNASRSLEKQRLLEMVLSSLKTSNLSDPIQAFKTGDTVLVWSLQSFRDGGFLNGAAAFISQDSDEGGESVLVAVERKIGAKLQIDPAYEVYIGQVKRVDLQHWPACERLKELWMKIVKS